MKKRRLLASTLIICAAAYAAWFFLPSDSEPRAEPVTMLVVDDREITSYGSYANLRMPSPEILRESFDQIRNGWHPGGVAMLLEAWHVQRSPFLGVQIRVLLEEKTGQQLNEMQSWQQWLWSQEYKPHPEYASFKSIIYDAKDERFGEYFQQTDNALIRLDEIVWGGVQRDGIPPLKDPEMISAEEATYLADSNEVFGVALNGEVRCYPKRILAWHEMFKDSIGGEPICGAY